MKNDRKLIEWLGLTSEDATNCLFGLECLVLIAILGGCALGGCGLVGYYNERGVRFMPPRNAEVEIRRIELQIEQEKTRQAEAKAQ